MKDHRKERTEARKKAEKLVSQMTLLEKASQLKYDAAPVKRLGVPAYNYWNEALHGVAIAIACGNHVPTGNCDGCSI